MVDVGWIFTNAVLACALLAFAACGLVVAAVRVRAMIKHLVIWGLILGRAIVSNGAENASEILWATTNYWGSSIGQYRERLFDAMAAMEATNNAELIRDWYLTVPNFPDLMVETGSMRWMCEKSFLMHCYAKIGPVRTSTNCWYSAARLLGRYRDLRRTCNSSQNEVVTGVHTNSSACDIKAQVEQYRRWKSAQCSFGKIEAWLSDVVTNTFPTYILPSLTPAERTRVLSYATHAAQGAFPERPCECRSISSELMRMGNDH